MGYFVVLRFTLYLYNPLFSRHTRPLRYPFTYVNFTFAFSSLLAYQLGSKYLSTSRSPVLAMAAYSPFPCSVVSWESSVSLPTARSGLSTGQCIC
jgi:hypothetical protein